MSVDLAQYFKNICWEKGEGSRALKAQLLSQVCGITFEHPKYFDREIQQRKEKGERFAFSCRQWYFKSIAGNTKHDWFRMEYRPASMS